MDTELLKAGTAIRDVTPEKSVFLFGYPHAARMSEGVHDPLLSSSLVLDNGETKICFCSVDVIFISKYITKTVRNLVQNKTNIKPENILISATHTHSGPATENMGSNKYDKVVPPVDENYIAFLIRKIAGSIINANNTLRPAELANSIADGTGVGGNRRDKAGLIDPEVPILVLREPESKKIFSLLSICNMHPTVLHEDSKLVSGDFPAYTRKYLTERNPDLVYLYHTGPEGNQSPRHFTTGNNFEEARRLGHLLAQRIETSIIALKDTAFKNTITISSSSTSINLFKKTFPDTKTAQKKLNNAVKKLELLRKEKSPLQEIRTAECDWFGAEETYTLASLAETGDLNEEYSKCLPAEIITFGIDGTFFTGWPGEIFIEFSLELKKKSNLPVYIICLANGTLGGYIVTKEADREGGYEASNSIFSPAAGERMLIKTLQQINLEQ